MACPLRNLVVIFSTVLLLYVGISSYWKARAVEDGPTTAARQVMSCAAIHVN
jgi:hypothetical protein